MPLNKGPCGDGSQLGVTVPPRGQLAVSGDMFGWCYWYLVTRSPRMLLNFLQCM